MFCIFVWQLIKSLDFANVIEETKANSLFVFSKQNEQNVIINTGYFSYDDLKKNSYIRQNE